MLPTTLAKIILKLLACASYFVLWPLGGQALCQLEIKVQSSKYEDRSYSQQTWLSESTIPMIVQSVGVSSRLKGKLASFPRHQKTNSPTPAPAASTATRGFPWGAKFLSRDWTTSSLRWWSDSFFTVATTVPITRASCIRISAESGV